MNSNELYRTKQFAAGAGVTVHDRWVCCGRNSARMPAIDSILPKTSRALGKSLFRRKSFRSVAAANDAGAGGLLLGIELRRAAILTKLIAESKGREGALRQARFLCPDRQPQSK